VTLNSESRITYPAEFADERSVELQGEAIFDVTHDADRPFMVATADMNVKVLGTIFDV
jgi:ferric-dicitrate binding protein FerR (iron transport regulator)